MALALRAELELRAEEIESVTVGLPRSGMLLIGEPAAKKSDLLNVVDGQFSGSFCHCHGAGDRAMGWDSYRRLDDPAIRALLPKIACENDPEIEAEFPANLAGKRTLRARGQIFVRKVVVPKGEPGNFPTDAELRAKFNGLADPILGADRANALADAVLAFDTAPGVGALSRFGAPHDGSAAGGGVGAPFRTSIVER